VKVFFFLLVCSLLTAADVPLVENEAVPSGRLSIRFEEDLKIGPAVGDDDHYLWAGSLITCEVDSKGHIYIVDPGNNRILEFDAEGNYQRQIGRAGQGPGEFTMLYNFQVMADDTAIAFDNNQNAISMSFFDEDKSFVRRTPNLVKNMFVQSARFARSGKYFGSFWITFEDDRTHTGIMRVADLKPVLDATQDNQVQFDNSRATERAFYVEFLSEWFKVPDRGTSIYGFGWDGSIYTAINKSYEITRYDAEMKPLMKIRRDYEPKYRAEEHLLAIVDPVYSELISLLPSNMTEIVTPDVVEQAILRAELSPAKPPVYGLFPVDKDGILIVAHDYDAVTGKVIGDIFDRNGTYAGTTELPPIQVNLFGGMFGGPTKLLMRDGHAYGMVEEDGELNMVRYRVEISGEGS